MHYSGLTFQTVLVLLLAVHYWYITLPVLGLSVYALVKLFRRKKK